MSSKFRLIEDHDEEPLTLFVGPDGNVTPDKETVKEILSKCSKMDINLMRMKNVDSGEVNIIMDTLTYVNTDEAEDTSEMTELERNLYNFKMDHDYTPFTSPSHIPPGIDMVDDLDQTLSMLEDGSLDPQLTNEPLTKITKIVKGEKQCIFVNSKEKQRMINAGILKEKPSQNVFKKPKPQQIHAVAAQPVAKTDPVPPQAETPKVVSRPVKIEVVEKKVPDDVKKVLSQPPPLVPVVSNQSNADKKVVTPIKKEKKQKPPMPDDMALFSTPDIIRRVGKDVSTPDKSPMTSPTSSTATKPAKISPDSRSKSNAEKKRQSADERTPSSRRMSLDSKKLESAPTNHPTVQQQPSARKVANEEEQVSVQEFSESNDDITDDQLEPLPSAEDIRAMIHSEGTKPFIITSPLVESEHPQHHEDPTSHMDIDAAALDLDQSILDNINTDLISEDILYKVAQSLVDNNTELQNAIDKTLTDGNLDLDASSESDLHGNLDSLNVSAHDKLDSSQSLPNELLQSKEQVSVQTPAALSGGTQIVRPDGRIVVIPPIERPTTRSRNKKPAVAQAQQSAASKPVIKPLDDQHVSGEELDSSANEEEDDDIDEDAESDDDPNKLWCICNQPHNNRFMICCDTCEEWYHGKCVNVTKAMGQQMEQQGKDWMCIYCKDPALKRPAAAMRRIRKASRTSTESSASTVKSSKQSNANKATLPTITKQHISVGKAEIHTSTPVKEGTKEKEKEKAKPMTPEEKTPNCVVCGKPTRKNSIYCSDPCILKHAQGVEKVVVFNRKSGQFLTGANAPTAANLEKFLADNPSYQTVRASNKVIAKVTKPTGGQLTQSKLKLVKNPGNAGVSLAVQKKGVQVAVLPHSPKPQSNNKPIILNAALKNKTSNIPGLKVVSKQSTLQVPRLTDEQSKSSKGSATSLSSTSSSSLPPQKLLNKIPLKVSSPVTKKEGVTAPQKTPKSRAAEGHHQPKQENLRDTVRKTFFEQLSNRLKNVNDLKLSDDELKAVSDEIESQLYRCFADTGQKYRNKYRSLIFNIKDPKNQTLWRRICEKSVNPYQLVRLSPDDLASQELALWRERETKHQLDMIKKSELELLNCNRSYVFKTHKGETVFEDDRGKDAVSDVLANPVSESKGGEEEDDKQKRHDKERKSSREKDGKPRSKSKDRDRKKRSKSRDRDRSRHSDRDRERRKSRSRDRHRDRDRDRDRERRHKSSRHKKDEDKKEKPINTEKLDKKSKEILEQLVDKQIVPPLEDKLWKTEEVVPPPNPEPAPPTLPESDSDHEPSSTVMIPTPPRVAEVEDAVKKEDTEASEKEIEISVKDEEVVTSEPIWKGTINMVDVATIAIDAFEVTGECAGLGDDLQKTLDIVGRISPTTVWDYIGKMKLSNSKSISVLKLTATAPGERHAYLSLYSYLSTRQRLGVVKCSNKRVKDFYILPLAAHNAIPDVLLPITGPGFGENRPSLLVGIIVRDNRKRLAEGPPSGHSTKRVRVEVVANRGGGGTPPSTSRSYTPPPSLPRSDPRVKLPVPNVGAEVPEEAEEDMDEPYSPADSDPESMQDPGKHLNSTDLNTLLAGGVKASSFLNTGITSMPTNFEPFANKFDCIPGLDNPTDIKQQMDELDQRIAKARGEVDKASKNLACSGSSSDLESTSLANIAIPSNLQQILESIKSIENKGDTPEYQPETPCVSLGGAASDLTIPLMLPKLSSRPVSTESPVMDIIPPIPVNFSIPPPSMKLSEEPKPSGGSVLSSLSEEDLIKKAAEMLGEVEPPPPTLKRNKSPPQGNLSKKGRLEMNQPPIPGLED